MIRSTAWLVMLLVGAASGLAEAATHGVLTLRDGFELESVSDPQISPDGTQVIYVRGFADIMTDRFYSNLWIDN